MNLNNANDWWSLLEKQWDNILDLAYSVFEMDSLAYETPGNPDADLTGRKVGQEIEHLKKTRDREKLPRYLYAIWHLTSDNIARSNPPGWSTLCDLCSEEWCLYEGEAE